MNILSHNLNPFKFPLYSCLIHHIIIAQLWNPSLFSFSSIILRSFKPIQWANRRRVTVSNGREWRRARARCEENRQASRPSWPWISPTTSPTFQSSMNQQQQHLLKRRCRQQWQQRQCLAAMRRRNRCDSTRVHAGMNTIPMRYAKWSEESPMKLKGEFFQFFFPSSVKVKSRTVKSS